MTFACQRDNITWTGTYTPNADVEDLSNVLTLDTNWTDTAGNAGLTQQRLQTLQ